MSGFRFRYLEPDVIVVSVICHAWHLTSYLGSCHCPWPLISQVCISRDICRHLPDSDWSSVCISGLWLADSVITASPSQYRVNLWVLTLGGSCRQCVVYSRARGPISAGGGKAASQHQPSTLQGAQYRSRINDNFLSGVQVFYSGHSHLANCQELN